MGSQNKRPKEGLSLMKGGEKGTGSPLRQRRGELYCLVKHPVHTLMSWLSYSLNTSRGKKKTLKFLRQKQRKPAHYAQKRQAEEGVTQAALTPVSTGLLYIQRGIW